MAVLGLMFVRSMWFLTSAKLASPSYLILEMDPEPQHEQLPKKKIIIRCDGTYDDFGDTLERTKPGSSTSRLLRWILPPLVYHGLWLSGFFALIKRIENWMCGSRKPQKPFLSKRLSSRNFHTTIFGWKEERRNRICAAARVLSWRHWSIRDTSKSGWRGSNWEHNVVQDSICLSNHHGQLRAWRRDSIIWIFKRSLYR